MPERNTSLNALHYRGRARCCFRNNIVSVAIFTFLVPMGSQFLCLQMLEYQSFNRYKKKDSVAG